MPKTTKLLSLVVFAVMVQFAGTARAGFTIISGNDCEPMRANADISITYAPAGLVIKNLTTTETNFFTFCQFPTLETTGLRTINIHSGSVRGRGLTLVALCFDTQMNGSRFVCGPWSSQTGPEYFVEPRERPRDTTLGFMYIGATRLGAGETAAIYSLTVNWADTSIESSTATPPKGADEQHQNARDAFIAEVRSPDWAAGFEETLLDSLHQLQKIRSFDISEIQCRSTMCKIVISPVGDSVDADLSALVLASTDCEGPLIEASGEPDQAVLSGYFLCGR